MLLLPTDISEAMLHRSGMNEQHDLGELTEDLVVNGMNTSVTAIVPSGESVRVRLRGMNSSVSLAGHGEVSLALKGMQTMAIVAPALKATVSKSGMQTRVIREDPELDYAGIDDEASEGDTESKTATTKEETRIYRPDEDGG